MSRINLMKAMKQEYQKRIRDIAKYAIEDLYVQAMDGVATGGLDLEGSDLDVGNRYEHNIRRIVWRALDAGDDIAQRFNNNSPYYLRDILLREYGRLLKNGKT